MQKSKFLQTSLVLTVVCGFLQPTVSKSQTPNPEPQSCECWWDNSYGEFYNPCYLPAGGRGYGPSEAKCESLCRRVLGSVPANARHPQYKASKPAGHISGDEMPVCSFL